MSRFFPHGATAEEQQLPKTILTTHVLVRGLTAGSLVASLYTTTRHVIPRFRPSPSPLLLPFFPQRILASAGLGGVIGIGLSGVALIARMWGREPIEWADRSWRLMENRTQLECDDYTYGLMGAGVGAWALKGGILGWKGAMGALGLGSIAGMVVHMGWRHGVNGGKYADERKM